MTLRTDLVDSVLMSGVHPDQHNEVNAAVQQLQTGKTITTNYTATSSDGVLFANANSNGITVTMPAVSSVAVGFSLTVVKTDTNWHQVVLVTADGSKINGGTQTVVGWSFASIRLTTDGSNWLTTAAHDLPPIYHAPAYGVSASNGDISTPLNNLISYVWNLGGGHIFLGPGFHIVTAATITIYPGVHLHGSGMGVTYLQRGASAQIDVVTFYKSNGSDENAFYAGLHDISIHGGYSSRVAGMSNNCVTAVTNPLFSSSGGDPDFDPLNIMVNVEMKSSTGHGFYASGRSGMRLIGCMARYNALRGFAPSFDTIMESCNAESNGLSGVYLSHSSDKVGAKSYNNGMDIWTTGHNWGATGSSAPGYCYYNGHVYFPLHTLTNDTTAPNADPSNWKDMGAFPDMGWGVFLDAAAPFEVILDVDCQQNTAGGFYIKGNGASQTGGVVVRGVCYESNFSNGWYSGTGQQTTNPNGYANVVLDNMNGAIVQVGISGNWNGPCSALPDLRLINGSSGNDVTITDDGVASPQVSSDSTLTGNRVVINGTQLSTGTPSVLSVAYATVSTNQTTTSTTFTDLVTTGPAVTVTVPASGALKVTVTSYLSNDTNGDGAVMGVALSGANTVAAPAGSNNLYLQTGGNNMQASLSWVITGLTPGSTTVTAKYRATTGGTATFGSRVLIVEAIG